jgi:hypothetical protein
VKLPAAVKCAAAREERISFHILPRQRREHDISPIPKELISHSA